MTRTEFIDDVVVFHDQVYDAHLQFRWKNKNSGYRLITAGKCNLVPCGVDNTPSDWRLQQGEQDTIIALLKHERFTKRDKIITSTGKDGVSPQLNSRGKNHE